MPRGDAAKTMKSLIGKNTLNVDRVLDSVYALPLISVENVNVSQQVGKTTGMSTGILSLEVVVSHDGSQHKNHGGPVSLSLVLGTPQRRTLLAYLSIRMGRESVKVDLTFDWNTANADGGQNGGAVILRLLLDETRGLDSEITVPLR